MKSFLAAALAATAVASPLALRQSDNIDPVVLQFALTLEHLENVFYKQALQKFSQQDFLDAGFPADYRGKLEYIASDEESHVKLLTGALQAIGQSPVAACTYKFPYTDVKSFVGLSAVIEGVGTSAYLGGAPLITSKDYLTVAGSILVAEALHTSYQRNSVGQIPFPNAYGTPLDPMSVFSIAAPFFDVCPSSNTPLPFTTFPTLTYTPSKSKRDWVDWRSTAAPKPTTTEYKPYNGKTTWYEKPEPKTTEYKPAPAKPSDWKPATPEKPKDNKPADWKPASPAKPSDCAQPYAKWADAVVLPKVGDKVSFTTTAKCPEGAFVTFISGLLITSVPATINGNTVSAAIPDGVAGQTYVFLSSADQEKTFSDKLVIAGPAIIEVAPPAPAIDYNYYKA